MDLPRLRAGPQQRPLRADGPRRHRGADRVPRRRRQLVCRGPRRDRRRATARPPPSASTRRAPTPSPTASSAPTSPGRSAATRRSDFPPVSDGDVMVTGDDPGWCRRTRRVHRRARVAGAAPPPILVTPAIAGGSVLVADGSKQLRALSMADGSTRWVHELDDVVSVSPAVSADADAAAVATDDGRLTVLDVADGSVRWEADRPSRASTAPAIVGGHRLRLRRRGQPHGVRPGGRRRRLEPVARRRGPDGAGRRRWPGACAGRQRRRLRLRRRRRVARVAVPDPRPRARGSSRPTTTPSSP